MLLVIWLSASTQAYKYNAWQKGKEKGESGEQPAWMSKVKDQNKEKRAQKEKLAKLAGGGKIREKHLERSEEMRSHNTATGGGATNSPDRQESAEQGDTRSNSAWNRSKAKAAEGNAPAWFLKQKEVQAEKGKERFKEKKCAAHPGLPFCQPGYEPPLKGGDKSDTIEDNINEDGGEELDRAEGSDGSDLPQSSSVNTSSTRRLRGNKSEGNSTPSTIRAEDTRLLT